MKWQILEEYPEKTIEDQWYDFLTRASFAGGNSSPNYFKQPFDENKNKFAVLAFEENRIIGVATGLADGGKITCGLAVRPQVAVDKNADQQAVARLLADGLFKVAKKKGAFVKIHAWEEIRGFEDLGFRMKKSEDSLQVVLLDLTLGAERLFKGFSQSRRSDLRKAMRENNLQISKLETLDELRELYEIHLAWCAKKNIQPDTWQMKERAHELREQNHIFIAKYQGKVIAGSYFRSCPGGVVEYAGNNSNPEFLHFRPNDLLVWRSIEWACENGFTKFSMGGSHLFLRRFGGEVVSTYCYQLDRSFLKYHDKKEAFIDFAIKKYQALPDSTRQKIKKIIGKT